MRVAVLGAGGMLGHDLVATAPSDVELLPFRHADLDITDPAAIERLFSEHHPDVVINAAAYTAVDRAEEEPEIADRVNGWAPGVLGEAAKKAGSRVIHFSTDYVFDGTAKIPYTEDAPTNPINRYGASKLMGERALQASGVDSLLIRTQWLFGVHGRSFPRTMLERALAKKQTQVVNDQFGRPTYTVDLSAATWGLIRKTVRGIVHVANEGDASWFDVAYRVFERSDCSDLILPSDTNGYPTPARRPRLSTLDTTYHAQRLASPLPHWNDGLERFLRVIESA